MTKLAFHQLELRRIGAMNTFFVNKTLF